MRGDDSTGSHPLPHHFLLFKKINFNASCIFHVQTQQWGRGEGSQGRDPDPGLWKSQPKGTQPLLCRMPDNVGADFSLWLSFLFFFLWNKQREVNSMAAEDLGSCQRIILLPLFFSIKSNITQCVDRFPEALALSWWDIFVVVPLFYLQQNGIHSRFKVGGVLQTARHGWQPQSTTWDSEWMGPAPGPAPSFLGTSWHSFGAEISAGTLQAACALLGAVMRHFYLEKGAHRPWGDLRQNFTTATVYCFNVSLTERRT